MNLVYSKKKKKKVLNDNSMRKSCFSNSLLKYTLANINNFELFIDKII